MKDESVIQQEIQMEAARLGCFLLRNNSGALLDGQGRPVRYGWGNTSKKQNEKWKSPDLIGIEPVVITQEMVGKTLGVFVGVECKDEVWNPQKKLDARETAQAQGIEWIRQRGGKAGFANSIAMLKKILGR